MADPIVIRYLLDEARINRDGYAAARSRGQNGQIGLRGCVRYTADILVCCRGLKPCANRCQERVLAHSITLTFQHHGL